ncbi:helix-turn-helix domain-containing protein [Pseudonocardia hispaniensis]|uniref:Helix-turn-helix domain-containing protein n=1 Tax=Pseudonocardia hispaniensis TaxID=904933 RepID=A0ABW1IY82_9PSEU
MSATLSERTVLPDEPAERMVDLLVALKTHGRPALVAADGTHIELPEELYEVLKDVVAALSQGLAITVAPQHTVLTTSQAADLLGVSRPTVVRLLEAGEIPFDKPGRHRRIRLRDLLAYQERARRARAAGLDEMVRASEDAGLYDLPADASFERTVDRPEVDEG